MTSEAYAHRLILRGGGSAAAGYLVRFGARLLFMFVAARSFGVSLFGAYSLAVAVVELAVAVGGLGMKRYLFHLLEGRASAHSPEATVLDAAVLVAAASLALAGAIMLTVLMLPGNMLAPNTALAILIAAPVVVGQALLDLVLTATRWQQRMRYEVTARSIVEPYVAIVVAAASYAAGLEKTGLLLSYWAGTLAALLYAFLGLRRSFEAFPPPGYRLSCSRLRGMLRSSAMPTLSDLTGALFARLDLYLVGALMGEAPVGIYNMARQMRTPARQVRQSFDGMLTPMIARTLAAKGPSETSEATSSATRLILVFQLVAFVGLVAIGQPVLNWLGPEFAAGYWAMVTLVAAETILGAFGVSDLLLLYRRPELAVAITSVSIVINFIAAWFLVEPLGINGAALSVLIAVAAGALLRRHLLNANFGIAMPIFSSAGPVFAAAVGTACALLVQNSTIGMSSWWTAACALAIGLGAYAAMLKVWLIMSHESLTLVKFTADGDA